MGYTVHTFILRAQRRNPKCAYLFIIIATVSRSLIVIAQHNHHLKAVCGRSRSDKVERIFKEIVEILGLGEQIVQIGSHLMALVIRSLGYVRTKALLPENNQVSSRDTTFKTVL